MDPDTVAVTASNALITAMTTDAWHRAVTGIASLWRRVHPERVETIEAELIEARQAVLAAKQRGETHSEKRLCGEWSSRLLGLVQGDPDLTAELQRLIDEVLTPLAPLHESSSGPVVMAASSSGHGNIYQAAGQQHIYQS